MSWYYTYHSPRSPPSVEDEVSSGESWDEEPSSPRCHDDASPTDLYDVAWKRRYHDDGVHSLLPNQWSTKSRSHNRARRIHRRALKDEVQKQARQKVVRDGSETYSADGKSTGRLSRSDREGSTRGRRSRRSRSLGRDNLSDVDGNQKTSDAGGRGRSRSQERRGPWAGGYWTYVPPSAPMWGSLTAPIGRTYTRVASPVQTVMSPSSPTVYNIPPAVHTAPIIGPPSNVVYVEPQTPPQSRVYVQSTPRTPRIYSTPSKPQVSVYVSPKRSTSRGMRKANVYIVDSDDDEQPLRRSHLSSGLRRSSSLTRIYREPVADSRLNDSIERAERSADHLRRQSRSMYRSVRDNVYRAQLLADTM